MLTDTEDLEEQRHKLIRHLMGADIDDSRMRSRIMAGLRAQVDLDDYRFSLLDPAAERGSLSWTDQTLSHVKLSGAVPVMGSIIDDPARAGSFLLDLSHEVTHAYSLIGAIGYNRTALRVATQVCEIMLAEISG